MKVVGRREKRHAKCQQPVPDHSMMMANTSNRPLKLPWSCEVVENRWFWGPWFVGEGIPQISDIHFQIALTSEHEVGFGWVPFSELWGYLAKNRRYRRIVVKPKSANNYVRRPHNVLLQLYRTEWEAATAESNIGQQTDTHLGIYVRR